MFQLVLRIPEGVREGTGVNVLHGEELFDPAQVLGGETDLHQPRAQLGQRPLQLIRRRSRHGRGSGTRRAECLLFIHKKPDTHPPPMDRFLAHARLRPCSDDPPAGARIDTDGLLNNGEGQVDGFFLADSVKPLEELRRIGPMHWSQRPEEADLPFSDPLGFAPGPCLHVNFGCPA